jgi:glycine betaine/choline ABC-type transport system substrate-binding protein
MPAEHFTIRGDGFNENTFPATLLKKLGLAALRRMIGPGFDEKTVLLGSKVFPEQHVLAKLRIRVHSVLDR